MSISYDHDIYRSLIPLVTVLESVLIIFTYFSLTWPKRQQSKETLSRVHKSFIGIFLIEFWYWFTNPVLFACKKLKLTPNHVTIFSLFLSIFTGMIYAMGYIATGGWLLIFSGSLDLIDGRLARETNSVTKAGAFLDSCLDRYSDSFVLMGIAVFYLTKTMEPSIAGTESQIIYITMPVVIMLLIVGTTAMSYIKARGETVGLKTKKGLMQRPERVMMLSIYSVLDPFLNIILSRYGINGDFGFMVLLGIMTLMVNSSALSRLRDIFGKLREEDKAGG